MSSKLEVLAEGLGLAFSAAYFLHQPLVLRLLNKPRESGTA